jgi:hypothetical protein
VIEILAVDGHNPLMGRKRKLVQTIGRKYRLKISDIEFWMLRGGSIILGGIAQDVIWSG